MGKLTGNFLIFILVVWCLPSGIMAQNTDSLFTLLVSTIGGNENYNIISTEEQEITKCATELVFQVQENFDKFTKSQKAKITSILSRPSTQASIVSPSGYFRIHYDSTGSNAIGYDVNLLAEAADSAYNYEINGIGFPEPPSDNGGGGDELYDIYVTNLGSTYGYTEFTGNQNVPSFMVIDNDFTGYYTEGIKAARVTVAHEFNHAIQVGSYIYRSSDSYFYELLSTSMEEFVYDDVNDYYGYMPLYFEDPDRAFYNTSGGGYDLAIWNIFLKDKYGFDVIKKSLENTVQYRAIEAIAAAVSEEGSSLQSELNDFGIWTYFTGYRAKDGEYFEEGADYPLITPFRECRSTNCWSSTNYVNPVSNNFLCFVDSVTSGLPDTLVFLVTNGDYLKETTTGFDFSLYSNSISKPDFQIGSLYYVRFNPYDDVFSLAGIFNNEIVSDTTQVDRNEIDYAFPQPFSYARHTDLKIPVAKDQSGQASLNIYTVSMELIYSGKKTIIAGNKVYVSWEPQKRNGDTLPTGVYIYVTKSGDTIKKGKFVIINDE